MNLSAKVMDCSAKTKVSYLAETIEKPDFFNKFHYVIKYLVDFEALLTRMRHNEVQSFAEITG